jgi:hypothetical protein
MSVRAILRLRAGNSRAAVCWAGLLVLLYTVSSVQAQTETITAEATYIMGDHETPTFAEAMVLRKAKQMAIKEAMTHVERVTKTGHRDLTGEELQAIAGGSLRIEILERKRKLDGDDLRFSVKIKVIVTSGHMEELADRIKVKALMQEYKKLQGDDAALTTEVEALKGSLATRRAPALEREAAQDRLREQEKVLAAIQKRESAFYARLLTGKDLYAKVEQQLTEERDRAQSKKMNISMVFEDIAQRGHDIIVGEPEVKARLEDKGQADLYFPVSITGNPAIRGRIKEALASAGGELSNATYRKFEQRLENLWFVLEVSLKDGGTRVCYVPRHLTKFQPDGEFVSMEEGQSNWRIRMTVPIPTIKEIISARGRFMEEMPGSACGVARKE